MAEWFMATVLKTVEVNSLREFESHSLRHRDIEAFDVFVFIPVLSPASIPTPSLPHVL